MLITHTEEGKQRRCTAPPPTRAREHHCAGSWLCCFRCDLLLWQLGCYQPIEAQRAYADVLVDKGRKNEISGMRADKRAPQHSLPAAFPRAHGSTPAGALAPHEHHHIWPKTFTEKERVSKKRIIKQEGKRNKRLSHAKPHQ